MGGKTCRKEDGYGCNSEKCKATVGQNSDDLEDSQILSAEWLEEMRMTECEPAYHAFIKLLNNLVLKMYILLTNIYYSTITLALGYC